jgi:hypothetical protein
MNLYTLEKINLALQCLGIAVIIVLLFYIVYLLIRKNYDRLKRVGLLLINYVVIWIVAIWIYISLAIIVQGPKGKTREISMLILKQYAIRYFFEFCGWSILVALLLFVLNYFYQRAFLTVNYKSLIFISVITIFVLVFASWLSAQSYYTGILIEVNRYFDHKNKL